MVSSSNIKACIQTVKLTVGYAHRDIKNSLLENLDLELRSGELVCFMGPNGVGKSTLIRTLAGLQRPLAGSIQYDGNNFKSETRHFANKLPQQIAVVLTDRITAVNMTVYEVVSFGRYPYMNWDVKLGPKDIELIHQTLETVRIEYLKEKKLYELSDGQLQMVMIARAVIQDTPIILMDEPTAHLDLNNRLEIMNLLRKLAHQMNKAILVATHELDLALQTADLIWLTGLTKNIITGIPEDLVLNGAFDSVFQFKGFDLKTGQVHHEAYRKVNVKLSASGHEYLWAKNALERNGFTVSEQDALHAITLGKGEGNQHWILNNEMRFNSLQNLLHNILQEFN
jgi:iron complex transport system ATP-binding protein